MTVNKASDLISARHFTADTAPMTRYVSQPLGGLFAALAYSIGASPNAVTIAGFMLSLSGCAVLAVADSGMDLLLAAIILQSGFAFDCADGQLARATGRQSNYGAWLDVACDHARNVGLGFAMLFAWLAAGQESGLLPFIAVYTFLAGITVYLHTASSGKVKAGPKLSSQGFKHLARQLVRLIGDTPVMLIVFCALRPWPTLLALYAASMGLLCAVRAIGIARLRLEA